MKTSTFRALLSVLPLLATLSCFASSATGVAGLTQDENGPGPTGVGNADGLTAAPLHPEGGGKVTLMGTAPANAEGKTVYARQLDETDSVTASADAKVIGSQFTVTLGNEVSAASGGNVVVFVDINDDSVCNIAPTDIGGQVAAQSSGTITLDANAQAPCNMFGEFSFTVNGNDFTPHNGQTIYAALKDTNTNAYVTTPKGIKVKNASWSLTFPRALLRGRTYQLQYFADLLASGKCQDHSWVASIPSVTENTTMRVSHDTAQTPICSAFPALTATP